MFATILSLLKNWKVIGGALFLIAIILGGGYLIWNYNNLQETNAELTSELKQKNADIIDLQGTLERERQQFALEQKALNDSLEGYQQSIETAKNTNMLLRSKIDSVGQSNEKLQQCLNTTLPTNIIDRLRNKQSSE